MLNPQTRRPPTDTSQEPHNRGCTKPGTLQSALDQATAFERTERHLRCGNEIIWLVLGRDQDWRTSLPSLLVAESATDYMVVEGTARLDPERPVEGIGSLAAQDRTVLDFVGEWPTKRGVPVHGWREFIASLGFDPDVVWRYRQGPGLGPTVISETLQGLVRLRARPAPLPVVISSVLRGRAVCVARRRPVKYVGTDGRHPRFLWIPDADHDHLLRLFAAAIGWDLDSLYEESCSRCGDTASGQGLVEPWGAVEPLMLCHECDRTIHAAVTTLVGAKPRPGRGRSADRGGSGQVRQGSDEQT